jgi:hypothetical protein
MLYLGLKSLTGQDMEIVAYYLLRNTKVSQTTFAHVPSDISTIISSDFFREDNLSDRMLHKSI